MAARSSIDVSGWLAEQFAQASPDLLREMVKGFAEALMSAEADAVCGAGYGERSPERTNTRNGYRRRERDTRVGSVEVAILKLRAGSCFPDWLLERRRRAEAALVSVVATSYLLGVSTRRMEKLVATLGVDRLSKSQVSVMARRRTKRSSLASCAWITLTAGAIAVTQARGAGSGFRVKESVGVSGRLPLAPRRGLPPESTSTR